MLYQSTRSNRSVSDTHAVLEGIAPDGGLYVDPSLVSRSFDAESVLSLPYGEKASAILNHLIPGFTETNSRLGSIYASRFPHSEVTPVTKAGDYYFLELYHGPTSAFKDVALSVLPYLITEAIRKEGLNDTVSILTATSGDTGKAALEGFHDIDGTEITVFFPDEGVSAMQKKQMLSQEGKNVRVCAVRGNFDDCQRGVKEAFPALKNSLPGKQLSSANSINVGRLVPQVVYYFHAYSQLMQSGRIRFGDPVDFVVPTGNFGDILAGYYALKMGLPVGRLICASNTNDVLFDFIETGVYNKNRPFNKTASPSMDILVSSNLERLLFYVSGQDTGFVSECMKSLSETGSYRVSPEILSEIQNIFAAGKCSEEECFRAIARVWKENSYLIDTHTAVGYAAAEKYRSGLAETDDAFSHPCVILSTASPFKFPASVLKAIGAEATDDDFENARRLSSLTGVPVPKNIASLESKPILHKDLIDPSELISYVKGE